MSIRRRHSQSDSIGRLATVALFSHCPKRELKQLARRTTLVTAEPGQRLIEQRQGAYDFFIIVSGEAEVSRNGQVVAKLTDSDYFGELALLDPGRRDATVTARTPMELLVLSQWDFEDALDEAPGMTRRLLAGMARRLRELDGES